jgi:hypothetical protein
MTEEKRKRGRPKKSESTDNKNLMTQIGFIRKTGMARNNFSAYVAAGKIIVEENGKIDANNPVNSEFIEAQKRRSRKKAYLDMESVPERTVKANLLKIESDARWKSIKAQKEMNTLINKKLVQNVFGLMAKNIRNLLFPVGTRTAPNVCALCGVTDSETQLKVQAEIDEEIARAIEDLIKVTVIDIQNDDSVETIPEDDDGDE